MVSQSVNLTFLGGNDQGEKQPAIRGLKYLQQGQHLKHSWRLILSAIEITLL